MQKPTARHNQGRIRNHIVPKFHLSGFSFDNTLHLFDLDRARQDRNYRGIRIVLNDAVVQKGFYTEEYETELSQKIETTGKLAMDRLSDRENLSIEDRLTLARYIHVYHYRTHKMKTTIEQNFDPILADIAQNSKRRSELLSREAVSAGAQYLALSAEMAEQWIQTQGVKEEMTQEFLASGLGGSPLRNFEIPGLFASLPWRILEAKEDQFVLGDSFFEYNAIDQPIFEKYVPLNSQQCLFVSRVSYGPKMEQDRIEYIPVQGQVVRAINSRTISAIARFVVSAQDLSWVGRACNTPKSKLPRIKIPLGRDPYLIGGFVSKRCPNCYSALRQESLNPFLEQLESVVARDNKQEIIIEETFQYICSNQSCGFKTDFSTHGSKTYPMGEIAMRIENSLVPNLLWDQIRPMLGDESKENEPISP